MYTMARLVLQDKNMDLQANSCYTDASLSAKGYSAKSDSFVSDLESLFANPCTWQQVMYVCYY